MLLANTFTVGLCTSCPLCRWRSSYLLLSEPVCLSACEACARIGSILLFRQFHLCSTIGSAGTVPCSIYQYEANRCRQCSSAFVSPYLPYMSTLALQKMCKGDVGQLLLVNDVFCFCFAKKCHKLVCHSSPTWSACWMMPVHPVFDSPIISNDSTKQAGANHLISSRYEHEMLTEVSL